GRASRQPRRLADPGSRWIASGGAPVGADELLCRMRGLGADAGGMGDGLEARPASLRSAVRPIATLTAARGFPALLGVSLVLSLLMGFRPSITPLGPGIDSSHLWALHEATVRGWRWGVDFVSTHGPYVYVLDTLDLGDLPTRRVVFEL